MTIPQKTFQQLVSDLVTSWSNNIGIVPTLNSGDALLAIFQAASGQLDFLQGQVLAVNNLSRAQTSVGADLDTWMAQFDFFRLPAVSAEDSVTFSSLIPAATQLLIPAGSIVQTTGGAIQYTVIADTTQPTWSPVYNAYVLAASQSSLAATVEASLAGSASNVIAGQLNQIASSIPGIDTVSNGSPIDNGVDAESDNAFLARFPLYLASLAEATETAIVNAAGSVQQGLQIVPLENINSSGGAQLGAFTIVVDNGTGSPPSGLLSLIYSAVYAVRGFTIQPFVRAPSVVTAIISLAIRVASGFSQTAVENAVKNAVSEYTNSTVIGGTLFISGIESAALSVAGVISIQPSNTTINSSGTDLVLTNIEAARNSSSNISVGTY